MADKLDKLFGEFTATLKRYIDGGFEAQGKTLADLRGRIETLEHKPTLKYRSTWSEGEQYAPSDLVTHGGALWHCREFTKDRPGTSSAWQLATKSR